MSQVADITEAKTPMGARLIAMRERNGITRKQAAEKAGIHYNTLHAYEMRDDVNPELKNLRALAKIYGTSVEYILEGTDPELRSTVEPNSASSNDAGSLADRLKAARAEYIRLLAEANGCRQDEVHITVVLNPLSVAQIAPAI